MNYGLEYIKNSLVFIFLEVPLGSKRLEPLFKPLLYKQLNLIKDFIIEV